MKKGIQILLVIVMVLSLGLSTMFAACAQETAPGAPTKISPQVPAQPATPVTPTTPATPAKPAPAPAAEVFKWKCGTSDAGETLDYAKSRYARIKEMSDGRLDITPLVSGALVPAPEMLEATAAGVLEMTENAPSWNSGKYPEADLQYGAPGTIRTLDDNRALWWEYGWLELNREIMAEQGVFLVSPRNNGGFNFWTTEKVGPVRTLEDVNGLKIRTFGLGAKVFEGLGAATTYITHEESYMALSLGTIDAYYTSLAGYTTYKHYEMCPYYMTPAIQGGTVAQVIANMDSWNSLPDDLKKILEVGSNLNFYERYYITEAEAPSYFSSKAFERLKDEGFNIELVEMSDELKNAIAEQGLLLLDEEAAKSPRCAQMVKDIKDLMRVQGYIK